jgi:hypothetical protein
MFRRLIVSTLICTGLLLGAASQAHAKGPTGAIVTGPGLARPITVTERVADLERATGARDLLVRSPSGLTFDRQAPTAARGPRYELRYMAGEEPVLVQHLYLSAAGGPTVYTPPGQHNVALNTEIEGGWRRIDDSSRRLLDEVGIPTSVSVAPPAPSGEAGSSAVRRASSAAVLGLLVSVFAVAGALFWRARRRRLIG